MATILKAARESSSLFMDRFLALGVSADVQEWLVEHRGYESRMNKIYHPRDASPEGDGPQDSTVSGGAQRVR